MNNPPPSCPHCGQKDQMDCHTGELPDRWQDAPRTSGCYERQLKQLTAKSARLEAALRSLKEPWCNGGDEPLPEDPLIDAVHPVEVSHVSDDPDRFRRFENALRMVGKRRSKYGLVNLVHWLLTRAELAEKALAGEGA